MRAVGIAVFLGLLAGAWSQVASPVLRPDCDSPEVEEAALAAQDYMNSQLTHGYKYALNQIDEVKTIPRPDGGENYVVEMDLLETKCHVLDPTPVANCTVRPRQETKVEADCDVVLSKVGGVLSVVAYKCKSEPESAEDVCLGCPQLVPLNDTSALQLVDASLGRFNRVLDNDTARFALLEVDRLATQPLAGAPQYLAEYAIIETNCTNDDDDNCVPLASPVARKGFCVAAGTPAFTAAVDCALFTNEVVPVDPILNGTGPVAPPVVPKLQTTHGLKHHHRLSSVNVPAATGLLSESEESQEVVPVVKRQAPMDTLLELPVVPADPLPPAAAPVLQLCPGRKRHF